MSRIDTPSSIATAPKASQQLLSDVQATLGSVPNMFRIIANSPQALEGYLALNKSLAKGKLNPKTRERIALAVAQQNGCHYCLSAHTYLGLNLAELTQQEINANRLGTSLDSKANAAVRFAVSIVKQRGQVLDNEIDMVRSEGYSDAEIVEIVAHVALNTLTNYMNEVLGTEIDFPKIEQVLDSEHEYKSHQDSAA